MKRLTPRAMTKNRLANETSPYLRQHADNPVHWYPWGEEAFEAARRLDRPIFLSIGYAACHWCHVMAHESFEDPETAAVMNEHFINVKVDREERPDVDRYYMKALHLMGQQGGWPLSMFLAPDGRPLWGGTYFPPKPRFGRPSFRQVLEEVARLWREDRDKLLNNAEALTSALKQRAAEGRSQRQLPQDFPARAAYALADLYDHDHGGLQGAPKFPQVPLLDLLWRAGRSHERALVLLTLRHICQGGIYDHLDGGFARYSTDSIWLVPHFEKMLYDNALLTDMLVRAWLDTGDDLFRQRIEETVSFVFRRLLIPGVGFASSLDADSEGEEGRHYVWSYMDLKKAVSEENRDLFFRTYGVTRSGNWQGRIILNRLNAMSLLEEEQEERLAAERRRLLERRNQRPFPARDDKVLASWNGLMITALVHVASVFDDPDLLNRTQDIMTALIDHLQDDDLGLCQAWNERRLTFPATADGLAAMIRAALALHSATGKSEWLTRALSWQEDLDRYHFVPEENAYAFARRGADPHMADQIFAEDDALPNYHALIIENLAHLAFVTGKAEYRTRALALLERFAHETAQNPLSHAALLSAMHALLNGSRITLFLPDDSRETRQKANTLLFAAFSALTECPPVLRLSPQKTLPEHYPAASMRSSLTERKTPALLLCRGETCSIPAETPEQVKDICAMLT